MRTCARPRAGPSWRAWSSTTRGKISGVLLAQFEEGRLAIDPVERARVIESAAWRRLYRSRYAFAKAKLALLHATGDLIEAFAD